MRMTREKGRSESGIRRQVVRDRARRFDRRDRVLEYQLVLSADLDDHGEFIEVLDARFKMAAIHRKIHGETIATREVEEEILIVDCADAAIGVQ